MADFGTAELETFRNEARKWLAEHFPRLLTNGPQLTEATMSLLPSEDMKLWTKRIGEKGWGTPTWPKQYGGGGLSAAEAGVLAEEMARIGTQNPIFGAGPGLFGHTLLE
jgi:alkylation response protein AidB-like acyl-CoA dehydrogenase